MHCSYDNHLAPLMTVALIIMMASRPSSTSNNTTPNIASAIYTSYCYNRRPTMSARLLMHDVDDSMHLAMRQIRSRSIHCFLCFYSKFPSTSCQEVYKTTQKLHMHAVPYVSCHHDVKCVLIYRAGRQGYVSVKAALYGVLNAFTMQ